MSELSAALETIQPELLAMTRLFGLPDAYWDPPARYRMQAEKLPGIYRITFYFENLSAARETAIPSDPDPRVQQLHRRRAARRLCKQTLYDLLRKMTGMHPYRVKLELQKLKQVSLKDLVKLKENLTEAEYKIKSGQSNIAQEREIEYAILR